MFDKIKGMVNSKEAVEELASRVGEQSFRLDVISKENNELKREFSDIRNDMKAIAKSQHSIMEELHANVSQVTQTRQRLEREIDDFKIMKSKLQQSLFEELSAEYRKELMVAIERLKTDVASFNELKSEIATIAGRTMKLSGEIEKLTLISSRIKREDFELSQYARKLMETDREKLRLMKQVDALERLISHERRRKSTLF